MQTKPSSNCSTIFPVLIGDIGGTNARFQIIPDSGAAPEVFEPVRTKSYTTIEEAVLSHVLANTRTAPRSALLAAAGPITKDGLDLTNCHWKIEPQNFLKLCSLKQLVLMNDFEAQALALPFLADCDGVKVGDAGASAATAQTKAVLGPGTGLGVGLLVRAANTWIPVAGEGGHVDLGPRSKQEALIWDHLQPIDGRISAEQLISGDGLCNLYRACCLASDVSPKFEQAADISNAALADLDEQAVEALSIFCTTLGRLAGDLALTSLSKGGVYIAGGIAQKILPFLLSSGFRSAFEDKAPHGALVRSIQTIVVTHPLPALLGLAALANNPEAFAVDLDHRCWKM